MTRGKKGVKEAVNEMIRVVKPNGKLVLCITPIEDMETEDQRVAVTIEGKVFSAMSLPKKIYTDTFMEKNVELRETQEYHTYKRLTARQTKTELKEGIEIARNVYGKEVPMFKEVWDKYGKKIEAFRYGMYSKVIVLIAQKLGTQVLLLTLSGLYFLSAFGAIFNVILNTCAAPRTHPRSRRLCFFLNLCLQHF